MNFLTTPDAAATRTSPCRAAGPLMGLLGLLLAACTSVEVTPPAGGTVLAIEGVTVVPMTTDTEALADHTVIVRGPRIEAVGPRAALRVPPGARTIDGRGRWLVPGLADMHVHLEHLEDPRVLGLFVAEGVTLVRNMDGRPFVLDWRARVAAGQLVGPEIATAGPIIDGSPPLRRDHLAVADAARARAAVDAQADLGYDFVKVYDNLSPEAYRAVRAAAQARGLAVAGHVPRGIGPTEGLGAQQVEHLASLGRWLDAPDSPLRGRFHWSRLVLAQPLDDEGLEPLARQVAAAGAWVTPTLTVADRSLATERELAAWAAEDGMRRMPSWALAAWMANLRRAGLRPTDADAAVRARGQDNRRRLLRALHAAGAGLLAGSDTPNAFVVPGVSLHQELAAFVEAGLPPGRALAAATRDAARALGQAGRWGTIVPGARADLLLLAADPLEHIGHLRRIEGMALRGRWLEPAELKAMASSLGEAGPASADRRRPLEPDAAGEPRWTKPSD